MTTGRKKRNFPEPIKRLLAERVAYICSNPLCRRLTIKSHTTEKKSVRIGAAGHIYGASLKGPRYDAKKTDRYVKSYDNGIWLCDICHRLVDTEKSKYESQTLINWKFDTELYVRGLVIQDTRLRQLRIFMHDLLSRMRIVSALPGPGPNFDSTFEDGKIPITRVLIETEQILYENEFLEESEIVGVICNEMDNFVYTQLKANRTNCHLDISTWKNRTIEMIMRDIMRYSPESIKMYLKRENKMVEDAKPSILTKYLIQELIL